MKAGKITAKLRDAVPVCLMVNGAEVGRYKNIELPDEIKALTIMDFGFITSLTGKFDFNLYFDEGVLPEVLPGVRAKITRAEKRAAKAMKGEAVEIIAAETPEAIEATASEDIDAETPVAEDTSALDAADEDQPDAPDNMEPVEPIAEPTGKKRGRPKVAEVRSKKQSA